MSKWNSNRLTAKLGIDYPIIQGALGGLQSQRLVAAVSNFGGLGSFGALNLTPDGIRDVIAEIRSLTSRPFAVNLWVSKVDEGAQRSGEGEFNRSLGPLLPFLDELRAPHPTFTPFSELPKFEEQARAVLDANVSVFSFIFGIPPREILEECRRRNVTTMGVATTPEEAIALADAGVDSIVASGFEGGGHRGSFLRNAEDSLIGTLSLVPQVADAVDVPVVAAGGIADARGIVAALALGAEGVMIGTAFLPFEESGANPVHREALLTEDARQTGLTRGFTGRLARGIRNRVMEELNRKGTELLPYPLQRQLVRNLAVPAEAAGRGDLMPLWAGQSAGLLRETNLQSFLSTLVADVGKLADS
ncbi:MAG TPA: nitronate monooxygenase [Gemmatimonadaceae bacterium]|nr:nitronate monooxygenase [Gemmatimonadaceae bacterium]